MPNVVAAFRNKGVLTGNLIEEISKKLLLAIAADAGKFFGDEAFDALFKTLYLSVEYSIEGCPRILLLVAYEFVENS